MLLFQLDLPRDPSAAATTRRELEAHLEGRMDPSRLTSLKLVASELVNNAVLHGAGAIQVALELAGDRARLVVGDEGRGATPAIRSEVEGDGGRGLRIVDGLAERWGVAGGATRVWAELAIQA